MDSLDSDISDLVVVLGVPGNVGQASDEISVFYFVFLDQLNF